MSLRTTLSCIFTAISLASIAQPSQAPLQNFISAGGGTGSVHTSTTIPTYFASVGQPAVYARPVSNSNGGGVMTANELMFSSTTSTPAPTITSFNPISGNIGTSVTISGTNFDATFGSNTVKFNGTTATVTAGSTTSLTTGVPSGATTGVITVTTGGQTATSSSNFTVATSVPAPTITSFNPISGNIGTSVTISGTNFDATFGSNTVKFNGTTATVTAGSTTSLTTGVPSGATTGPITVTTGGQTATSSSNFTVTTGPDTSAPIVTDNTPNNVNSGGDITITANITDPESTISAASVSYRSIVIGGSLLSKVLVASGSTYSVQIPAAEIGELGVMYKLSATSGGGVTTDASFKLIKINVADLAIPYSSFGNAVSSYRIVAVPLMLGSSTVSNIFADDLGAYDKTKWRMYRYDNGTTSELSGSTTIAPGLGYWLIVKSSATIDSGPGTSVLTSDAPFEIDLKADWNEIGNPYNFAISWADVQAANPGLPGLRTYNGDFVDGTKLNKMEGGFVKVTSTQKLKFPVVKNASVQGGRINDVARRLDSAIDQPDWQVYFTIQQESLTNRISGLGMNRKALLGFDVLDGFNMPEFFESFIELKHNKKEGNDFYSSDIVPPSEQYVWDFNVASTQEEKLITLSWDNSYFGSSDRELYLWDETLKRSINMRTMNSYSFQKNVSSSFKVFYGDMDFIKEKADVEQLIVHSVWPNPAEKETVVSFSLPASLTLMNVEFEIADLLGRKIWNHQSAYSSGYHEVIWQRMNDQSAGIYFIRLTSGKTSELRRLVLK